MKTTDTLENLKADLLKVNQKRHAIGYKIEALEKAIEFPLWVEKFKGKYFKYMNGVSANERWPVYIFVSDVTFRSSYRGYDILGFAFERDYKGDITFKTADLYYMVEDNTVEITKAQFTKALKRIQAQVSSIIS
jgi:hypothetical protein